MKESVELALKRIEELEKKIENYYSILYVGNELDFVLKGSHILQKDIDDVIKGEFGEDILNSIETLKQELIAQKNVIEEMGGVVAVANNYPSPSEITAGIRTVTGSDFSITTATEADVLKGKTFYSGNADLKTGMAEFDVNAMNHLFMFPERTQSTQEEIYYTMPDGVNKIKRYTFNNNYNKINFTFRGDIETIEEYAFYGAKNFKYADFDKLTKLKSIQQYAFSFSSCEGLDLANMPNTITSIGSFTFFSLNNPVGLNIKFPDSLSSMGNAVFRQDSRVKWNNLDLSNYPITYLPDNCFQRVGFDCDFVPSASIKEVGDYFNYCGSFKNITIPAGVTLRPYCFSATSTEALSLYYLETVTFEGETPGTIGTTVFAPQNKTNNFKIYVPDNSLEAYKALSSLSTYVDYIYPMSQKD